MLRHEQSNLFARLPFHNLSLSGVLMNNLSIKYCQPKMMLLVIYNLLYFCWQLAWKIVEYLTMYTTIFEDFVNH